MRLADVGHSKFSMTNPRGEEMAKALVILAEGFEEIEAVSAIDIMRRGCIDVTTAALSDDCFVQGSRGIPISADASLDELLEGIDDFDAVILPGGALGMRNLKGDSRVAGILRKMDSEGKLIAAICAAPIVLGDAGVIGNRNYTCYPSCEDDIEAPNYVDDKPVVTDGNLITSRGPATAMAFGIELVRRLAGDAPANKVAQGLLAL